ncbi:hypothetical protein BLNAU_14128 [Blattamonas nauphoetae]|uniref:Uncharacterized protein n=1 Tax=Blattamonas nauphoetae TaxID=2049346 RepID=A0ABQ9XEP9_9EUKA|nr:hypothetical protein BLNAU_14128 [Blattamonas nauphoetae]
MSFSIESDLSFEESSHIFRSFLAAMKDSCPLDDLLLDKVVFLLKKLTPSSTVSAIKTAELIPSSDGSSTEFVNQMALLLSSPHRKLVEATLSFVFITIMEAAPPLQMKLVEADLLSKVLQAIQSHISLGHPSEELHWNLFGIIFKASRLAKPYSLPHLEIVDDIAKHNHYEMLFLKLYRPSALYLSRLFANRYLFAQDRMARSFLILLGDLHQICPFHRPTLDLLIAQSIDLASISCLACVEMDDSLTVFLHSVQYGIKQWSKEGPYVKQNGRRLIQALTLEGYADIIEERVLNCASGHYGVMVVLYGRHTAQQLGGNIPA